MSEVDRDYAVEAEIDRARRAAAVWERNQGRESAARIIEAGQSDESAIMRTMLWLHEPAF